MFREFVFLSTKCTAVAGFHLVPAMISVPRGNGEHLTTVGAQQTMATDVFPE